VSRDAGIADVFWVRATAGATSDIASASNVAPILITTMAAHGLATGAAVIISGVPGNIAANGVFTITVVSPTTFMLDESRGIGAPTHRAHPFANIAAVSSAPERMDVLFVGRADGTPDWMLIDGFWTSAASWGAPPHSTIVAPPAAQIDPLAPIAACSRDAHSVDAFVIGLDGGLYVATLDTATGAWSAFVPIAGPMLLASVDGACRQAGGGASVVATGRDGNVYSTSWNSGAVTYRALTRVPLLDI
jgi:hypothetical protein